MTEATDYKDESETMDFKDESETMDFTDDDETTDLKGKTEDLSEHLSVLRPALVRIEKQVELRQQHRQSVQTSSHANVGSSQESRNNSNIAPPDAVPPSPTMQQQQPDQNDQNLNAVYTPVYVFVPVPVYLQVAPMSIAPMPMYFALPPHQQDGQNPNNSNFINNQDNQQGSAARSIFWRPPRTAPDRRRFVSTVARRRQTCRRRRARRDCRDRQRPDNHQ